MDATLHFQLMGGLAARRTAADGSATELDLGGPRPRRLLAALLLSLGQPLTVDRLIELVWDDEPPASARGSLQAYISNLRRQLEPSRLGGQAPQVLVLRPGGYQLLVDRSQLDTGAFEAAITSVDPAVAQADPSALAEVLDRWAPLLPELADAPFVRAAADRLDARRRTGFELLQSARLASGDHLAHLDAIADLRAAVIDDPRAERWWSLLALARYRSGDAAAAVATIHDARAALRAATGLDLGPELRQLEADLYAQSPTLDLAPAVTRSAAGPGTEARSSGTARRSSAAGAERPRGCRNGGRVRTQRTRQHHRTG